MFTEYKGQNNKTEKTEEEKKDYLVPESKETVSNKIFGFVWKILLVVIVFVFLFLGLMHFGVISLASKVTPDMIVLNQSEVGIKKGRGFQLVTTVLPVNAENKQVVYESSDPSVASVNEVTGYVTALKNGTAVITVKTLINDQKTECIVNVGDVAVSINSINLKQKNFSLASGSSALLSYVILPANATENNINFSSSDSTVAKVDSKGLITALKEGNAIITASANNGAIVDTANVTVYKKGTTTIVEGNPVKTDNYPNSVSIPKSKNIKIGESVQLEPTVTPDNSIKTLSWFSTNPEIAEVNQNGLVIAKKIGTAAIVVSTINNQTAICQITVGNYSIALTRVFITTKYSFLRVNGQPKQLFAAYEPPSATEPTIVWSSSNPNVATVDSSGVVRPLAVGSTTIEASTKDGKLKDRITIEVGGTDNNYVPLKAISIKESTRTLYVGSSNTIIPTFDPTNATFTSVTYESSDPSIATVDSNSGVVLGLKEGKVTITVRTKQDNISANVIYNVKNNPSTSVELSETVISIAQNESYTLLATVKPNNASNKTVTYTTSNANVATVDKSGRIVGISPGTATITVTPNGGGSPSVCTVTVY